MIIRPETPADYADIAGINARAFGHGTEPALVSLLRHRRDYDPELALVAEIDGRRVGYAMFVPYRVRLLGETVPVVNLAPLAVDVMYQRTGIGGALIAEGHRIAQQKGYALSMLLGHSDYYPR